MNSLRVEFRENSEKNITQTVVRKYIDMHE